MTKRTKSGARVRSPLTDLENAVMRVVWDSEPCSVEAVYEVVSRDRDLKETTVRTLLRRLEQKGYLRHESEGRAYLYRSTERPRSLAARAVRQIIDRFCQGSVEELVSGMVDAKMLSKAEMDRLEEFVRSRTARSASATARSLDTRSASATARSLDTRSASATARSLDKGK